MFTRRLFVAATSAAALSACSRPLVAPPTHMAARRPEPSPLLPEPAPALPMPEHYGAILDEPYPVPAIPEGAVPPDLWRQEVANPFPDRAVGSIVVDPEAAFLYLIEPEGRARRYAVSVGRAGFAWDGEAVVQYRRRWPRWKAPDSMIARQPELEPYSVANGGMDPGPGNPMGARALYLFQNGEDTLYRIHGACEPQYLGQAVSAGCIRLLDHDIIDLHDRVRDGAKVLVLSSTPPMRMSQIY